MAKQKKALGRGLSAILSNQSAEITPRKKMTISSVVSSSMSDIAIDTIQINPFQPRTHFHQESLEELAKSIKQLGVIQPITVRKLEYEKYQIISGERRFKASKIAGLKTIPAYIRTANDQEMLEMALVENIQRQDLDAIEIAMSYDLLIKECQITQEKLSDRVGKKRSTITNYLRLLKLNPIIQAGIRDKMIGIGHAKSIANIEDEKKQLELYKRILTDKLSVRKTDLLANKIKSLSGNTKSKSTHDTSPFSFYIQQICAALEEKTNCNTEINIQKTGKGKLVISFQNKEQLEHIIKCFKNE